MSRYKYALVKQQVDGYQYIGSYVKLKKVGLVYKGCCPFHHEKTPSFTVYPKEYVDPQTRKLQENASFYCFGCGLGGDVITFKQLQLNNSLLENENEYTREQTCSVLIDELSLDIDDENAELEYLKEELRIIEQSDCKSLSVTEVNLVCSSICRNYLLWVKKNYPIQWDNEIIIIEKYYNYFDSTLPERTSIESLQLIDDVKQKIDKRRNTFYNQEN